MNYNRESDIMDETNHFKPSCSRPSRPSDVWDDGYKGDRDSVAMTRNS